MNSDSLSAGAGKANIPEPRSWEQLKVQLLKIFTTLTEEDLDYDEDKKSAMIENLQVRLGKTKEELIAILEII